MQKGNQNAQVCVDRVIDPCKEQFQWLSPSKPQSPTPTPTPTLPRPAHIPPSCAKPNGAEALTLLRCSSAALLWRLASLPILSLADKPAPHLHRPPLPQRPRFRAIPMSPSKVPQHRHPQHRPPQPKHRLRPLTRHLLPLRLNLQHRPLPATDFRPDFVSSAAGGPFQGSAFWLFVRPIKALARLEPARC